MFLLLWPTWKNVLSKAGKAGKRAGEGLLGSLEKNVGEKLVDFQSGTNKHPRP
jgi:hypothetical protein